MVKAYPVVDPVPEVQQEVHDDYLKQLEDYLYEFGMYCVALGRDLRRRESEATGFRYSELRFDYSSQADDIRDLIVRLEALELLSTRQEIARNEAREQAQDLATIIPPEFAEGTSESTQDS